MNAANQAMQSRDVPDPVAEVHLVGQPDQLVEWHISQNLTDRWGEINDYNATNKPLELLIGKPILVSLVAQMWDEITFVARKDGQFGLLFEVEYCSIESEKEEGEDDDDAFSKELKPHADVIAAIHNGLLPLVKEFPGVAFSIPDKAEVVKERPAVWAFVPDGLLTADQRERLGMALLDL